MNALAASATADDIKRALSDPRRVCDQLGLTDGAKRQAQGLSVRCPSHDERDPSCSVTLKNGTIRVCCFACDLRGNVFHLVAAVHRLDVRRDFPKVLDLAADMAGLTVERKKPPRPQLRPVPQALPAEEVEDRTADWEALDPVDEECWDYLRGRGLADAADFCRSLAIDSPGELGRFGERGWRLALGLHDRDGRVIGIQARSLEQVLTDGDGKDQRFRTSGKAGVFGQVAEVAQAPVVVVCEGLTDTLTALVAFKGKPNVAIVGIPGISSRAELLTLPLERKRVLVALDADGKGDEAAATLMDELRERKAQPIRARPVGGKDLADMHGQGADLVDFFRAHLTGFRSIATGIRQERAERVAMQGKSLAFGVRFLDLALGGIFPDDTVLIGAKTGRGKTEFATTIARTNARAGKRVHYIALEAARYELERRIKYPIIAQLVWEDRIRNGSLWQRMNYLDWYKGDLDGDLDLYERAAEEAISKSLSTMFVRYKGGQRFDADVLDRAIRAVGDETDMVLVDHVHYLDTPDETPENRAVKEIMKRIRDAQDAIQRPVVIVAHIRKGDQKRAQLVPDIEDFHGSSDIPKIATKAVMIAPALDQPPAPGVAPTYIEPAKCRAEGSRTRYTGLVPFNFRTGRYGREFVVGRFEAGRTKFVRVPDEELPEWAIERATP